MNKFQVLPGKRPLLCLVKHRWDLAFKVDGVSYYHCERCQGRLALWEGEMPKDIDQDWIIGAVSK